MSDASVGIPGITGAAEIGRGGFGIVYRATESELGRDVAVKLLTGQLDERSKVRFERERRAMGALSSHPNIVTIFRSGITDQGAPYLIMEYLPGGSLAERLASAGTLSWEETVRIGVELSGALETAHRAGVLHRDVKPGNVMTDGLGRAKLGDFGIARLDGSPETKSAVVTASVAHAPPEVIAGQKPDERADVYSLGSTLFELANGMPAFARHTDESMIPMFNRIANEPAPDLRAKGAPDRLATVLERAMAKDAAHRYGSAAEFGRALNEVQRDLGYAETRLWLEGEPPPDRQAGPSTQVVPPPTGQDWAPPTDPSVAQPPPAQAPPPASPSPVGYSAPQAPPPGPQAPPPGGQHGGTAFVPPPQNPNQFTGQPSGPGQPQGPATQGHHTGHNYADPNYADPNYQDPYQQGSVQQPYQQQSYEQQPSSGGGSKTGAIVAGVIGLLLLMAGGAYVASLGGDDDGDDIQTLTDSADDQADTDTDGSSTETDPDSDSGTDGTGSDGDGTDGTTTTTAPSTTTTTAPPPTDPPPLPRAAYLADLPELPAVAPPYGPYKTVTDANNAFSVRVPNEWPDVIPTAGQLIASPDNNAALADETVTGILVNGIQGVGVWDADFFLDSLIESLADDSDPCSVVKREPYVDGPFDGVIYAELCRGGELLSVSVLVSSADRDAVIFVGMQMTDERDMAAFEEALASFILFDPALLPEPT